MSGSPRTKVRWFRLRRRRRWVRTSCREFRETDMATEAQEAAKIEQLSHVNPDESEVAAGREREQLEGWVPELASEGEVREALEKAFDYRGDVTITRKDGSKVEGYLFDRRTGASLKESFVRLYPKNSNEKVAVSYAEIGALAFSGRDTAAGT